MVKQVSGAKSCNFLTNSCRFLAEFRQMVVNVRQRRLHVLKISILGS